MDTVNIFDGKIVYHKGESDRTRGMTEEARSVLDCWRVVGESQVLDSKAVVSQCAGLWKAIHAFSNLGKHIAIVEERWRLYCSMMLAGMSFTGMRMYL